MKLVRRLTLYLLVAFGLVFALDAWFSVREHLRLFDADGRPISLDQAGLPDRVDSLEMLLAGTQKWLHNRPQLLQQLQAESEELDRLLAWVGGKKP